ncbi:MAG: carbon storage regulator [Gammaproteobacteria bacterium]
MLKITRNIYDTFYINGAVDIEIDILDIQGKQVKLGLKIPNNTFVSNKKILGTKKLNKQDNE